MVAPCFAQRTALRLRSTRRAERVPTSWSSGCAVRTRSRRKTLTEPRAFIVEGGIGLVCFRHLANPHVLFGRELSPDLAAARHHVQRADGDSGVSVETLRSNDLTDVCVCYRLSNLSILGIPFAGKNRWMVPPQKSTRDRMAASGRAERAAPTPAPSPSHALGALDAPARSIEPQNYGP